jgi:polygalacturonase
MAVVDVIYDDDNLTIFGPPDQIELSVDIGSQGNSGTIQVGSVATVEPGTPAAVSNVGSLSNAILNFTIPQGQTGAQGPQGIPGDTVPISTEQVQDAAVPLFNHAFHTGFTVNYDDANNRLLFTSSNPVTNEDIQDVVGALFTSASHSGISASYNDNNASLSLSINSVDYGIVTVTQYADVASIPSASSNTGKWAYVSSEGSMYYSHNNLWNKINNFSQEQIQDFIAPMFTSASNFGIVASYNDENNTVILQNQGILNISGTSNEILAYTDTGNTTISLPSTIITPGTLTVGSDLTVNSSTQINEDLIVLGNLTVSGSTIYLNTNELNIEDNLILLNSSASGAPIINAGLEVERGSSSNVSIIWNEGSDKWQFTNDGVTYEDLGAAAQQTNQKATNFYDIVRDYGASNNAADSYSNIQNALNAARDAGGGTVYIPNGTWNLGTDALRIYSNTTILLSDGATIVRNPNLQGGSMLINGVSGASYSGYNGQVNIKVIGGTWDSQGNRSGALSVPHNIFSFGHTQNILFEGITFKNVNGYHAIEINSARNVLVKRCRFMGFVNPGDNGGIQRNYSEAIQIDAMFRSGLFGDFGSYDKTTCDNITVEGCWFGASGDVNTIAWPTGVGSHSADTESNAVLTERWHTNTKIINNHFEGLNEWAVRTDAVHREVLISGNTFKQCSGGIGLGFKTLTTSESWHASYNYVISNNIFQESNGTSRDAIQARNIDGMVIENNIIRFTGRHGVYLINALETIINSNRFEWINQHGIFLDNPEDCMVSNNILKNVSTITSNTYSYIIYSNTPTDCSTIANRGFKGSTGNVALFGLRIPDGTGMRSFGNFFGTANVASPANVYSDNSTSPSTTTTNG